MAESIPTKGSPEAYCKTPKLGGLNLSLKFDELGKKKGKKYGKLHVRIINAKGLPPSKSSSAKSRCYVSLFTWERKASLTNDNVTKSVDYCSNPNWGDIIIFHFVTLEELAMNAMSVNVVEQTSPRQTHIVGGIRLGPSPNLLDPHRPGWKDSNALEYSHWEKMIAFPGKWVECCHSLRSALRDRDIKTLVQSPLVGDDIRKQVLGQIKDKAISPALSNYSSSSESSTEIVSYNGEVAGVVLRALSVHSPLTLMYFGFVAQHPAVMSQDIGSLVIAVMFEPTSKDLGGKGNLHVKVKEARNLKCNIKNGILANCNVYPHLQDIWIEKRTKVIKDTKNPVWEKIFIFRDYIQKELHFKNVVDISLWSAQSGHVFVGRVCLGPEAENSTLEEVQHWEAIFANPGEWMEAIHELRP